MATKSHKRPLKILTLDGGGLQALTTLSILGEICKSIAVQKGVAEIPAPYELFDVICGIGTGGWLALLLGRYRLDVPSCIAVYMEMAVAIDPHLSGPRGRSKHKAYRLDQLELIAKIKQVLNRYELKEELLDEELVTGCRCQYVFAAGAVQDTKSNNVEYQLFRTYKSPAAGNHNARKGPDPRTCKVWEACAATGAAKYYLQPFSIEGTTFFDDRFPDPHPIGRLALEEVRNIFGAGLEISTMVNIGPGIPHYADVRNLEETSTRTIRKLTRKFSWPTGMKLMHRQCSETSAPLKKTCSELSQDALSMQRQFEKEMKDRLPGFGAAGSDDVYFHLGPEFAESGLSLNDVSVMDASSKNSKEVLESSKGRIHSVAQHIIEAY